MQVQYDNSHPNYTGDNEAIDVLDYGFVALHNISGPTRRPGDPYDANDIDPANTARMSFGQMNSNRTKEADLKLCEYLLRNKHTTPFEMIECWIEMKLPIFVARQFVRHRTVSINEISGRYVTLPAEWYIPRVVGKKPDKAKQGQEDNLPIETQEWFQDTLMNHCQTSYYNYLEALDAKVAPEHARLLLHLNHYTHWMWKQDLHNIMHFLRLRTDNHAQIEAQMYARAIEKLLFRHLPATMKLYKELNTK